VPAFLKCLITAILLHGETEMKEELMLPDPNEVSEKSIACMMTKLAAMQTALAARLLALASDGDSREDHLLTIDQAAAKLKTSKDWLYRNSSRLPFTLKIGRNIRFSENGLDLWIKQRTGGL
jgi:predicted DNA-binding transcriptional regulator AlpA